MSALFLDDSPVRIPIVDRKEIRPLLRFLPLIVLVPRSHVVKDHGVPPKIAASKSLSQSSEAARVLGLPGKAAEQFKSTNTKNEFAFGDARVHFAAKEFAARASPWFTR